MEASIPFCDGFSLGQSLDVSKHPFQQGPLLVPEDVKAKDFGVNLTTAQFCIVTSINDVCDVLQLPLAYVLKVEANLIRDEVVTSCLKDTEDLNNTTCFIFRVSFLQQKQYLPYDINVNQDILRTLQKEDQPCTASDSSEDAPVSKSDSVGNGFSATHWVKALEVGNELLIVCRISSPDREDVSSAFRKLTECLGSYRGLLESKQLNGLEEFAKKMDKKLKKKQYSHMKLSLEYLTFLDLQYSPADLTGMVNVLREFNRKCEAWTDIYKQTAPCNITKESMTWKKGTFVPPERGIVERISSKLPGSSSEETLQYFQVPQYSSQVDSGDLESIEVVASDSDCVHYLRAIIQSLESGDQEAFDMIHHYPQTLRNKFNSLHKFLMKNMKVIEKLQRFMASDCFISGSQMEEGRKLRETLYEILMRVNDTIDKLDLINVPNDDELQSFTNSNPEYLVDHYIENVMTKLPPGADLDLLIIGKTGHGKSSTGNSILGQAKFHASASSESVTESCGVGWTLIDGRTIKVVDTPGVCDTRHDSDQTSIDVTIRAISEAIVQCPDGFHALLLVIRFGQRMTIEERKAVGMLKCILGEDVIKSNCVCVITHGDNFKSEMKGQTTFEDWCRNQSGFLKEIFEECQYRCVLFDNKVEDPKLLKRQVIELVAHVDSVQSKGTRYTNSLFAFASNERKKAIEAEKAPEVDENITRDIQMVLDHLDRMMKRSSEAQTYAADLEDLKYTVDNLKNQVSGVEGNSMETLVNTVFSLAQVIHENIENEAKKPFLDPAQKEKPESKSPTPEDSTDAQDGVQEPSQSPEREDQKKSPVNFSEALKPHQDKLKEVQDNIAPKVSDVNKQVTEKVEKKVKEEKNCFPGSSWVILKDGSRRAMRDLKVGDEILVKNGDRQLAYEKVYMFGHRDVKVTIEYLIFETQYQRVMVSLDHLVYCSKNGSEVCLPARLIKEGDGLLSISNGQLVRQPILRVSQEKQLGLYAPFTKSGTLFVDGCLMSCYVDVLPPAKAHKLLSPIHKLYQICPPALEFINGSNRGNVVPTWAKLYLKWKKIH